MSYLNKEELRTFIGQVGIFYNDGTEKSIIVGKLISVTQNGNCENEDNVYYDEFEPKTRLELLRLIHKLY